MRKLFNYFKNFHHQSPSSHAYFLANTHAKWSISGYKKFASDAYMKNVIAHRSIAMIANSAASVPFKLFKQSKPSRLPLNDHPILNLLRQPNPIQNKEEFMESIYAYKQIAGNAYILAVCSNANVPKELYVLRPDHITVVPGENFIPKSYLYQVGDKKIEFPVNPLNGRSLILHIKNFHPLSNWYGLSSIEAASYSIDQHNQAGEWNQSLLQNGARPSGAIVVKGEGGNHGNLTDQQYGKLKELIDDTFSGPHNAGRPIILEGGLDWREMSMSPKDMDYIESKHSSARDIALALGMPPQLIGIPGDNTYANLQEARLALWEQTIIPVIENVVGNLSLWLSTFYGTEYELSFTTDEVSALTLRKEALYNRLENCRFMTINEKRQMIGLGPIENGNQL